MATSIFCRWLLISNIYYNTAYVKTIQPFTEIRSVSFIEWVPRSCLPFIETEPCYFGYQQRIPVEFIDGYLLVIANTESGGDNYVHDSHLRISYHEQEHDYQRIAQYLSSCQ